MSKDNLSVKSKKPWPTKKAMEQVYDLKLWGAGVSAFYSGEGSHHPEIVVPYVKAVTEVLSSFKEPLVVCDLGCGDFNIGSKLVPYTEKYTGVDIVIATPSRINKLFSITGIHLGELQLLILEDAEILVKRSFNHDIYRITQSINKCQYLVFAESWDARLEKLQDTFMTNAVTTVMMNGTTT